MVGFRFAATILAFIVIIVAARAKEDERKFDHNEERQKERMAAGMKEAERAYDHNKLEELQQERRAAGDLTGQ